MDITEKLSIIPRQEQPKPRPLPKAVIDNDSVITQYEGNECVDFIFCNKYT